MKQISDAKNISEALSWSMRAKRVTYRQYGLNSELRRPMIHRFEVPDGDTVVSCMVGNITKSNTLLSHLMRKGK